MKITIDVPDAVVPAIQTFLQYWLQGDQPKYRSVEAWIAGMVCEQVRTIVRQVPTTAIQQRLDAMKTLETEIEQMTVVTSSRA